MANNRESRTTLRRAPLSLVVVALCIMSATAGAKESPSPQDLRLSKRLASAATAFLQAHRGGDDEELEVLAARHAPDPWLITEQLLISGENDAAAAFAARVSAPGTSKLADYVERMRASPPDSTLVRAIGTAWEHWGGREHKAAIDALAAVDAGAPTRIASIYHTFLLAQFRSMSTGDAAAVDPLRALIEPATRIGWMSYVVMMRRSLAKTAVDRGAWRIALSELNAALGVAAAIKHPLEAQVISNVGYVHNQRGDYPKAIAFFRRSIEQYGDQMHPIQRCHQLVNLSNAYESMGQFALAIETAEDASNQLATLGAEVDHAAALINLSNAHASIGDLDAATKILAKAVVLLEKHNDHEHIAIARLNLGRRYLDGGRLERAEPLLSDAVDASGKSGDVSAFVIATTSLAELYQRTDRERRAAQLLERVVSRARERRLLAPLSEALRAQARLMIQQGNADAALPVLEESLRITKRLRAKLGEADALESLALFHAAKKSWPEALQFAIRATELVDDVGSNLGSYQATQLREQMTPAYRVGVDAAFALERADAMLSFMESARAGALLRTLGGRDALRWVDLPAKLKHARADALADERRARVAYESVLENGTRKDVRDAARVLDEALRKKHDVVAAVQRSATREAGLPFPPVALLEDIQIALEDASVLVVYGYGRTNLYAMVIDAKQARVVSLGDADAIDAIVRRADLSDREHQAQADIDSLRAALVTPLGVPNDTARVLISPASHLAYVPFSALIDQPVVLTPSGTTHTALHDAVHPRGEGVLGLGDPDYAGTHALTQPIRHRGGAFARLPASRKEVDAIADVRLLAADANEVAFAADVTKRARWRAVHFACHGLVDPARPLRSSLVLSRVEGSDGYLTAMDVVGMDIPADLVALSACETARGKVMHAEGIVGLTRAFLHAGSSRVLASLWKVDDEATSALMQKFYSLWHPERRRSHACSSRTAQGTGLCTRSAQVEAPLLLGSMGALGTAVGRSALCGAHPIPPTRDWRHRPESNHRGVWKGGTDVPHLPSRPCQRRGLKNNPRGSAEQTSMETAC